MAIFLGHTEITERGKKKRQEEVACSLLGCSKNSRSLCHYEGGVELRVRWRDDEVRRGREKTWNTIPRKGRKVKKLVWRRARARALTLQILLIACEL